MSENIGKNVEITVETVTTTAAGTTYAGPLATSPPDPGPPPPEEVVLLESGPWDMQNQRRDEVTVPAGTTCLSWAYDVMTPEPDEPSNGTRATYLYCQLTPDKPYKDSTVLAVQLVRAGGRWKMLLRAGDATGEKSRVVEPVAELPGAVVVRVFADYVDVEAWTTEVEDGELVGLGELLATLRRSTSIGADYMLVPGAVFVAQDGHEDADGTEDGKGDIEWWEGCVGRSMKMVANPWTTANVASPAGERREAQEVLDAVEVYGTTTAQELRDFTDHEGMPAKIKVSGDPGRDIYHPFVKLLTPERIRAALLGSRANPRDRSATAIADRWCRDWHNREPYVQEDMLLKMRRIQGGGSPFTKEVIAELTGIVDLPPVEWGKPWVVPDSGGHVSVPPGIWRDLSRAVRGQYLVLAEEAHNAIDDNAVRQSATAHRLVSHAERLVRYEYARAKNAGRKTWLTDEVDQILAAEAAE